MLYKYFISQLVLYFCRFSTECSTIPTVTGATATVNGQTPVTPIDYNTQVDYTCNSGYSPNTVQSVKCGVTTAGQVDVSGVACARSNHFFLIFSIYKKNYSAIFFEKLSLIQVKQVLLYNDYTKCV